MAEEDPDSKNALTRNVLFSQNNRILKNLDPVFPLAGVLTAQKHERRKSDFKYKRTRNTIPFSQNQN